MTKCAGCRSKTTMKLWELGSQPLSFEFESGLEAPRINLTLLECSKCGLIQLENGLNKKLLNTLPNWVTYQEPEDHLNELEDLCRAEGVWKEGSKILGLSDHDSHFLDLIEEKEGIYSDNPLEGIRPNPWETEKIIDQILEKGSYYDVIVTRRILEHFENPNQVLMKLHKFGAKKLLIEIPDSGKSLEQGDVTMLWEEHKCYFSPSSFKNLLTETGWVIKSEWVWEDTQEDTRCVLVEPGKGKKIKNDSFIGVNFKNKVFENRIGLHSILSNKGTNAIFGVGHRSVAFLNYHHLGQYITSAYDDHKMKLGRKLPGTDITIKSTEDFDPDTAICLLAMGPSASKRVREKFSLKYPTTQFFSILPDSHFFGLSS